MPLRTALPLCLALAACSGGDKSGDTAGTATGGGGEEGSGEEGGGSDGGDDTGERFTDCAELVYATEAPVVIRSQAELDPFCDSANAVDGDLYLDVGGTEDPITELDGIKCLCAVEGDLIITGDSSRTPAPDGAAASSPPGAAPPHVVGDIELVLLERVGGDLVLSHHPQLDFVQSLVALREVGGDIVLRDIPELQVIKFFGLETVGGTVVVEDMAKLLVLGMEKATALGGLQLGAEGDGESLYFLVEVGLGSLQTVSGDLRVVGPRNLALLRASELRTVGGALELRAACFTQPSFGALTEVGTLHLAGNCGLKSLGGFSSLATVTGFDTEGHAVRIEAQDGLDPEETAAFVAGLDMQGGDALLDLETPCSEVLAAWPEGYCG